MRQLLFVYGTLKRGGGLYSYLVDQTFLGEGLTKDKHLLSSSGIPFVHPGCLVVKGSPVERYLGHIRGELFSIDLDTLYGIDRVEGGYVPVLTPVLVYNTDEDETNEYQATVYMRYSPGLRFNRPSFFCDALHEPNEDRVLEWNEC